MKAPYRPLFLLSMIAVAAYGTGCDRKGRAPVRPGAGPTSAVTSTDHTLSKSNAPLTPVTSAEASKSGPVASGSGTAATLTPLEQGFLEDSKLNCKFPMSSDDPTVESFKQDFTAFQAMLQCIAKDTPAFELVPVKDGATGETSVRWVIDSSPERGAKLSKLLDQFDGIAGGVDGTNSPNGSDEARTQLHGRFMLIKLGIEKFSGKYNNSTRFNTRDPITLGSATFYPNAALMQMNNGLPVVERALKDIEEMKRFVGSRDLRAEWDAAQKAQPANS